MNYFLVDFENISTDDMKNLDGVCEGDTIVMFFSENRKNISLDFIEEVLKKGANFKTMKAKAGTKNALDFQLTSYLGYLIGKYKDASEYIIVSHDTGYDCLKSFWKNMGVKVKRASFSGSDAKKKAVPTVKAKTSQNTASAAKEQVKQNKKQDAAQPSQQAQQSKAAPVNTQQSKAAPANTQQSKAAPANTQQSKAAPANTQQSKAASANMQQITPADSTGKKKPLKKSKVASKDLATVEEINALVSEEENPAEVLAIVNQYKTKTAIANGLSKLYKDTKKASVVYKKLKPLLKEKNKS